MVYYSMYVYGLRSNITTSHSLVFSPLERGWGNITHQTYGLAHVDFHVL